MWATSTSAGNARRRERERALLTAQIAGPAVPAGTSTRRDRVAGPWPAGIGAAFAVSALWIALTDAAQGGQPAAPVKLSITDPLPYAPPPIDYHGPETDEAIAGLKQRLDARETHLAYDPARGYLLSLLEALDVPVESQVLVFSRTAVHRNLVGPRTPRAIYFNDEVYVAWVPGAEAIELSAIDPRKGAIFYSLSQQKVAHPRLARQANCLTCHAARATLEAPGLMVRSVLTDAAGNPESAFPAVTHATPLAKRWGGWYVTGDPGVREHLGNRAGTNKLRNDHFAVDRYPWPHSDVVSHLVLEHQIYGQNLLIRAHHEALLDRHSDVEEQLVRYLVLAEETALENVVPGSPEFVRRFESRGPDDPAVRSLRKLNLRDRLFEHRLSYLFCTRTFAALPKDVKTRIARQMQDLLTVKSPPDGSGKLPAGQRAAILDLLRATRPDLWGE